MMVFQGALKNQVGLKDFTFTSSINVMLIGDADSYIRALEAIWPGCCHDSRVWRNSEEKVVFEGQRRFMLAGDSAYPLSPTMMKPYKVLSM